MTEVNRRSRTLKAVISVFVVILGLVLLNRIGRDNLNPFERNRVTDIGPGGPSRAPKLPAGTAVERDVAYGPHSLQAFDVYIPAKGAESDDAARRSQTDDLMPILFMVHGGGWRSGDKTSRDVVQNKAKFFLPRGFLFVSVNYRLGPDANPVEQVDDVAEALAFVQQNAEKWGGDGTRVVVMGHSAGAHLVAMLTSAPEIGGRVGVQPWLGTVSLDSAAYNVVSLMARRHLKVYDLAFGQDPAFWHDASPLLRLTATPPPMLLICSKLWAHSCGQAEDFAAALRAFGGRAIVRHVIMQHNAVNRSVGSPGRLTNTIVHFIRSLGLTIGPIGDG